MIVGDLFSGIGGFSLAARWMGWQTAWFAEVDPYASRVLAHHWPDVPNLGDVTRVDWSAVAPVDLVTAGFPCQPHSVAGKRLASHDERDLFDEIIRCLRVVRPRFAVLENVPGLFTSESGRFFGRVLGSLAACGYDAEWRVVAAADVGAPHKRERVWIVGHANGQRQPQLCGVQSNQRRWTGDTGRKVGNANDARPQGLWRPFGQHVQKGRDSSRRYGSTSSNVMGWGDAVPVRGADGTVRLIPREAAEGGPESALWPVAHGVSGRVARLRGIGNAIVPQVAYEIFRELVGDVAQEAA